MQTTDVATFIQDFFQQHLHVQRGLSQHTIRAYRDTMKLFLQFATDQLGKTCTKLTLEDLSADLVRGFMEHLEQVRKNQTSTRNLRLATIHCFFKYIASTDPRLIAHAQMVLAVPFKRTAHRIPEYLDREEVQKLFSQIERRTLLGQRDDALLRLLYNTGMRAQEMVNLNVNDLRLTRPHHVLIHGKGSKERTCPIWKETVSAIKAYLARRSVRLNDIGPLFVNANGSRLTRFGIRHIVSHRIAKASDVCPSLLNKRITPHSFRHTTALHLLQANVDLSMIRSWLGHASIETTNGYVEIDLEMKQRTLESCNGLIPKSSKERPSWKEQDGLLEWLSNL